MREPILRAGPHRRAWCPAWFDAPHGAAPPACQAAGDRAACIVAELDAGVERALDERDRPAASGVAVDERDGALAVSVGGVPWCRYRYRPGDVRPVLHPIAGPHGIPMTRAWPLAGGVAGEETDHVHHRSCWVAHGLVNGVDFWSEADGHGVQVRVALDAVESGPVFGRIVERLRWEDAAGQPVVDEQRTLIFWNTPERLRMIDVSVRVRAAHGAVLFGDTKEGGIVALRVPEAIKEARGGIIVNGAGGVGERECWGQRAPWVDCSGTLPDPQGRPRTVGVAVLDHPRNPHYPTFWHVRAYGLLAANPFGLSYYRSSYRQRGDWTLAAGAEATFRYRIVLHAGDAVQAAIRDRFVDWAWPPQVLPRQAPGGDASPPPAASMPPAS